MNAELLLAHFDRISNAPNAISRMRSFILALALRGKLLEPDPTAEPASELLTRIREQRKALLCGKAIKPIRANYGPISVGDDFALPTGWVRSTIDETCDLQTGATPDRTRSDFFGGDIRWLVSGDVNKGEIYECEGRITQLGLDRSNCKVLPPDSVVIALNGQGKTRASVALLRVPAACNQSLVAIIPLLRECLVPEYLFWNLRSRYHEIRRLTGQDDRRGLNMKLISCFQISIPPVTEQHRIVAKVNELMTMCDLLEKADDERERRRKQLTAASHHHLNNGANLEALRTHSFFYINYLPRLTAQPEQIPSLRRTILSLAVRGQLVPQSPTDEPASELLQRIQAEIAHLVSAGEVKEQKRFDAGRSATEAFDIPQPWVWVSLGQVAFGFRYGTSMKCSYERTGEPVLRIPNIDNGRISIDDLKFGPLPKREADELRLRLGDILMVRSNGSLNLVGRPALVEANAVGYCYAGYLVRVRTSNIYLDGRYLLLALSSAHVRDQIEIPIRTTVGLKNVNATELSSLTIPLPPLAEQHRIVAKVDELMALCDRLEAQLIEGQDETTHLLESVLHHALNDDRTRSAHQ